MFDHITHSLTLSPSIPPSSLSLSISLSVAGVIENLESGGFFSEKVSKACLFSSIHDAVLHCQTDRAKINKDDEVKHTNTHVHTHKHIHIISLKQIVTFKHLVLWGLGVGCWQLCFSI